jgi:hypothetical protein
MLPMQTACFFRYAVALVALALVVPPSRAADLDKLDFSIKEIPEDAAYYNVWLRNKEQVDIVANSKAWAKLTSLPTLQQIWQIVQLQIQFGPGAQFQAWYGDPANKELVALIGDLLSNEVFIYGGANSADFAEVVSQTIAAVRYGPAIAQLSGQGKGLTQDELVQASLFHALASNIDRLQTPDLIIGFKLSNTKAAENQLKRLEDLAKAAADNEPKLKGRIKREKVAGGDFLTLSLDGTLIPWEELLAPLKDHEEKPGQHAALVKKLSALKQTLAIGVRNGYLLVALGQSTAPLTKLGQGKKLTDRPELQPLAKHADKRLTSVAYLSKAFNTQISANKRDVDGWMQMADEWIKNADLPADKKTRMKKDLADLAKDLKENIPEAGAVLSFGFLTKRGSESYHYDWGEHPAVDASKPLTLLDHVGGSPIFAAVARTKYSPEAYPKLVKWLRTGWTYVDEFVVPQLDETQKEQYQKFMKVAAPLLKRLDETTGQLLLPSLADGQVGLVVDNKLSSKQWFVAMPASDKALPMLEPALVLGVSDAAKLEKAFGEYRSLANDVISTIRKIDPDNVPEFTIPPPQTRKLKAGTMYFYPLPEIGLEKKLLPNAGLTDKLAVLSISQEHTERLLAATPLKTDSGPLADSKRAMAGAMYLDWAGLMDTFYPWVNFGVGIASGGDEDKQKDTMKQVTDVFDILKCLRSYSSATYLDGRALVTHGETVWRDLP